MPNVAPVITVPFAQGHVEGMSVSLMVSASDADSDPLTFTASGLPAGLSIDAAGLIGGTLGYDNATNGQIPAPSFTVTVSVSDGSLSDSGTIVWGVGDTNRLPSTSGYGNEGQPVSLSAQATDNTGTNSLTYTASGLPSGLSINASTGLITGAPNYRIASSATPFVSFTATLTLTDDHGGTDTRTLPWTVLDAAVLNSFIGPWVNDEGSSHSFALSNGSTNGLTFSASGAPSGLALNASSGLVTGVIGYNNASLGATATMSLSLTVSDSMGLLESATDLWFIPDVNRLSPSSPTVGEGEQVSLDKHATDNTGTNSLTSSVAGLPPGLSLNPATGLIRGYVAFDAVTAGTSATFSSTLTLSDDHGGSDTTSLVWTVPDKALFANADAYSLHFDTPLRAGAASGVLGNDRSSATGSLTASLLVGPAHGTLSLSANGSFLYAPSAGYTGGDNFSYTLTDGAANTAVGTVTLSISDPGTPMAANDSYAVLHDQNLAVASNEGILANDSDSDAVDRLTVSLVAGVGHGTLSLFANGAFLYAPSAGYVGNDSFTYAASDGLLSSATRTVSIAVTNSAPSVAADSYGVHANAARTVAAVWGVLANDVDADGDALSASVVSGQAHGTLSLSAEGGFTFTPSAGYSGPDAFTYRASDGATSATATVTLNVHSSNATPSASVNSFSVQHDQTLSVPARSTGLLVNDSDGDGDALSASLGSGPSHGTLALSADGSFAYTPDAGYVGSDGFTYTSSDGVASTSATVSLSVTNPHNPVGVSDGYSVGRNNPLSVPQGAGVLSNDSDADGDALTASLVSGPAHGTLTLNADGSFLYAPDANYTGSDGFTYSLSDGAASGGSVSVALSVSANAPVGNDDSFAIQKNGTLSVAASGVLFNDLSPDGLSLTASLGTGPAHGTLTLSADGSFVHVPTANYTGSDAFTYTASDGTLASDPVTVSISIHNGNSAPNVSNQTFTLAHDTGLGSNVLFDATDADDDPLRATLVAGVSHGTLALRQDGAFQYNPSLGFSGTEGFTFAVLDGTTSVTRTATLIVTDDAPVAVADSYSVLSSGTTSFDEYEGVLFNDSDAEGDDFTAVLVSGPTSGTLALDADGSFDYTAGGGFIDSDSFSYKLSYSATFTPTVTVSLTRGPVGANDFYVIGHDRTLSRDVEAGVLANDSVANGASLTASLGTGVSHGTLTLSADGSFDYVPDAGYVGSDSFTYTVSGNGLTAPAVTVSLEVTQTAPEAQEDLYYVNQDGTLSVGWASGVLGNDSDSEGDALSAKLLSAPAHGQVALGADGGLVYVPAEGFFGEDSFTYEADDGLDSTTATVTVQVNQVIEGGLGSLVAVATGDFDGDDAPDAVAVDEGQDRVLVYLNDGAGVFSSGTAFSVGDAPTAVAVGDFDAGGHLDLAVSNGGSGTVSVLLGNGDGTFGSASSVSVGSAPSSVAAADFDGDADLDLAVANAGADTVSVLLGDGDGTFGSLSSVSVGDAPSSLVTADFDGDGFQDLAVANAGSDTVSVLLGEGDGTFQPKQDYATGDNPVALAAGDVLGHGFADLLVAIPSPEENRRE